MQPSHTFAACVLLALAGILPAQCVTPGTEDFETAVVGTGTCSGPGTLPSGWSNVGGLSFVVDAGGTSSVDTGPAVDHTLGTTGGIYAYTEVSGCSGTATLESPCFDVSGLVVPAVSFWYHAHGTDVGTLQVEVFDGAVYTPVLSTLR